MSTTLGDQVPVNPSIEVEGNEGAVPPRQIARMVLNVAGTGVLIVTVPEALGLVAPVPVSVIITL